MATVLARLDKTMRYVICGRMECGARLAEASQRIQQRTEEEGPVETPASRGLVQFLPGWAPGADGMWSLSRYARLRLRRGSLAKLRSYPAGLGGIPNDVMDDYYGLLPVKAKCPTCGFVNELLPEELQAELVVFVPAELEK